MHRTTPGRLDLPVVVVALAAAAWVCHYTWASAPAVPIWDAWAWIEEMPSYAEGGIAAVLHSRGLANNEHFYTLPTAIYHATGTLTEHSMRPFAFVSAASLIALGTLFFFVALSAGAGRLGALLAFLAVVSMRNHENLLGGFQFGIMLSVAAGTGALVVADRWRTTGGLVAGTAIALVSVFSSAIGVFSLALVVAIRFGEQARPRRLLVAMAVLVVLIVLAGVAFYALDVRFDRYVDRIVKAFVSQSPAAAIADWVKVVGGGLIGGKAATAVGLVEIGWLWWCTIDDVRAHRRLGALSAIALFSLASSLAVAWGRSPFDFGEPSSRWAIFAAPANAVAIIWAFRRWPRFASDLPARLVIAVPVIWLIAANAVDAAKHRKHVEQWAFELRTYLAYFAAGDPLGADQLRRFSPAAPERTRRIVSLYSNALPNAYRDGGGIELALALPANVEGQAAVARDEAVLQVSGPGYAYNRLVCKFETGCRARLIADVATQGRATLGIIVRTPAGAERTNFFESIDANGMPHVQAVAADVAFDERLDPYVFSFTANDRVRIRSFAVVMSRIDAASPK